MLVYLLLSLIAFALVGYLASQRGRSVLVWFIVAFIFTPFVAALILIALGEHATNCTKPYCQGTVPGKSKRCKSCGDCA